MKTKQTGIREEKNRLESLLHHNLELTSPDQALIIVADTGSPFWTTTPEALSGFMKKLRPDG